MQSIEFQSERDRVRDATDLVHLIGEHIALKPKGREHVGLCPFHDDHRPSFAVVTHKDHAFYKCFACGASGDCFRFVMDYHKMSFGEAISYLAERAGITLQPRKGSPAQGAPHRSRSSVRDVHESATAFFDRTLRSDAGSAARAMLEKRRVSPEMVKHFRLGAAPDKWDGLLTAARKSGVTPDALEAAGLVKPRNTGEGHYDTFRNRLMFPICDDLGRTIAFGARVLDPDDEPKYLNSPEHAAFNKSATLYALNHARRAIVEARNAIVTEGYMDAIACHQAGFTNAVATLGTALTIEHAGKLKHLCDSVTLIFDADEAGMRAADRAVQVFFSERLDVRICVLPDGLDPDEMLLQDGGPDRFQQAIDSAADALTYRVSRFRAQLDTVTSLSARQRVFEQFMQELSQLGFSAMQGVRKRLVITQLADLLGVSMTDIERAMPRTRPRPAPRTVEPTPSDEPQIQDETEADVESLLDDAAPTAHAGPISRACQIAEQELLAVLLYDSSAAAQVVRDEHGQERPVWDVHPPESFAHAALRPLAQLVLPWLKAGEAFGMQRVLGELAEPSMRRLASALFEIGARRCNGGDAEAARTALIEASMALLEQARLGSCMQSMGQFNTGGADEASATQMLTDLLERRRRHATVSMAIARGVRSD